MPLRGLAAAVVLLAAGAASAAEIVKSVPVEDGVRRVLIRHPSGTTYEQVQVCVGGVGWFAAERDLAVGSYVLSFGGRRQLAEARAEIAEGKRTPERC